MRETTPLGAFVIGEAGEQHGSTPLTLNEIPAGRWRALLDLTNCLPVVVDLEVQANTTVTVKTNLAKMGWRRCDMVGGQAG